MTKLPPGFHFYPTDEELVVHFLQRKSIAAASSAVLHFHPDLIPDLHLCQYNPWDLHGKAMEEGNTWYFYSRRTSANRTTETGHWMSMGGEEPIFSSGKTNEIVGIKTYYVFCLENASSSSELQKTNWIMQEFRLSDHQTVKNNPSPSSSTSKRRSSSSSSNPKSKSKRDHSKWVLCRVYQHCDHDGDDGEDNGTELSCMDEVFLSLDDLDEISYYPNDEPVS